jgi:hypothetical protein
MLSGKQLFNLMPRVTFGEVISRADHENILAEIEHAAQRTLSQHMAWANA